MEQRIDQIGYATYSDGLPGGLTARQERMIEVKDRLENEVREMRSEKEYFLDMVHDFRFFAFGLRDLVVKHYDQKISARADERAQIIAKLEDEGVPVSHDAI